MSFLSKVETNIRGAAMNLIALMAGADTAITGLEASSPLVGTAIQLAEAEVPGLSQVPAIEHSVLAAAQAVVAATQSAVPTPAAPAPAAPAPAAPTPAAVDQASGAATTVSGAAS